MGKYEQPRRRRRSRRKRRRRRGSAAALLLAVAAVLAVGFGISLFFKVEFVEVTGTLVCDNVDVMTSSGIQNGDSLFFTNKSTVIRSIMAEQPYVDTVKIRRKFPSTIQIIISECEPVAFIAQGGSYWLSDDKGKLLEKKAEKPVLAEITGLTLLSPIPGIIMEVGAEDSGKVKPVLQILDILRSKELYGDVQEISYSGASGVSFKYQQRFTVKLGLPTDIDKKLNGLPIVVAELEPNAEGTIDLSNVENKEYRFIPI